MHRTLLAAFGLIAFLLLWEAARRFCFVSPLFVPPPSGLPAAFLREIQAGYWVSAVLASLRHYALGLALALQRPSREVVLVADQRSDPTVAGMLDAVRTARRPGTLVAVLTRAQAAEWAAAGFSLFDGRDGLDGVTYVCHDRVCALPVRNTDDLLSQLAVRHG